MKNSLLFGLQAMFLPLLSKAFRKSIAVVAVLGISLSPAQVSAQRDRAAPEAPEKISKSAARAQAERQRAAAAEAQRQRAAARAEAENARLTEQQAYANQQALVSNTVPPTAQADCYGSFARKNWSAAFVYCSADAAQGDADARKRVAELGY